jgi:DNA-binding phage protein
MPIFQMPTWLKRPDAPDRTPRRAEAFIEARNRGQMHQLLLSEYVASGMSQTELAKRTGKRRETISRVLGHPTNIEINTASKILFALTGKAIKFVAYDPAEVPNVSTNHDHRHEWASAPVEKEPKRRITVLSDANPTSNTASNASRIVVPTT